MSALPLAQRFASLVRFEHTIFALPYAYVGAILAVDGWPGISALGWITVAMFGARSFAMAVNRLVDAAIDARNPRTAGRELPAGRLRSGQVVAFALASLLVFVAGVSQLAPITRWLAPLVIVAMVIYPYLKRYTPLCHLWLGAVDGLAPVGGWVAVTGHFDLAAWLLGAAVACWIAGFDVIYATMDIDVDRAQGLHSIPADYGIARALNVSRALHALSVVALAGVGLSLGLGPAYAVGVVAVAVLLAYEQQLVSPTDLSRVNMAFLNVNGVIALLYLGAVSLDVALS
jgi:4-hydroxybenzoate polyprenyltransferase